MKKKAAKVSPEALEIARLRAELLTLRARRVAVTPMQLQVLSHASKDSFRAELQNLFVEADGSVVATDGHVAMWASPQVKDAPTIPSLDAIIPKTEPKFTVCFDVRLLAQVILTWQKMVNKKDDALLPVRLEFHGSLAACVAHLNLPNGSKIKALIMPCRNPEGDD